MGRERQLLVAASPRDEIADTHWYRPDFDRALVAEAETEGVEFLDATRLEHIRLEGDRATLEGDREGRPVRVTAGFVVDASGSRGFLQRALGLEEGPLRWLPPTHGLYSHFESVTDWEVLYPAVGVAAVSDGCSRAAPCVSGRLDLGASVQ